MTKNVQKINLLVHIFQKKNGEVLLFGNIYFGQLNVDESKEYIEPSIVMRDNRISKIACGFEHSMILKENGEVNLTYKIILFSQVSFVKKLWVFGSNRNGE